MIRDRKLPNPRSRAFNLPVRDSKDTARPSLSLGEAPRQAATEQGSDPYNTSGSFDRKKNWARVGKR
jgi:hypothetical protein